MQFEVMTKSQIDKVKETSKAGDIGPWKTYYEEMAKKTVIRRLFKYLPASIEIQKAVVLDEKAEAGISQNNDMILDGDFNVINQ
ncbi:recombinase RecT [Orbus sturtevantii]